jgi:hypothetical protein
MPFMLENHHSIHRDSYCSPHRKRAGSLSLLTDALSGARPRFGPVARHPLSGHGVRQRWHRRAGVPAQRPASSCNYPVHHPANRCCLQYLHDGGRSLPGGKLPAQWLPGVLHRLKHQGLARVPEHLSSFHAGDESDYINTIIQVPLHQQGRGHRLHIYVLMPAG